MLPELLQLDKDGRAECSFGAFSGRSSPDTSAGSLRFSTVSSPPVLSWSDRACRFVLSSELSPLDASFLGLLICSLESGGADRRMPCDDKAGGLTDTTADIGRILPDICY